MKYKFSSKNAKYFCSSAHAYAAEDLFNVDVIIGRLIIGVRFFIIFAIFNIIILKLMK